MFSKRFVSKSRDLEALFKQKYPAYSLSRSASESAGKQQTLLYYKLV